MKTLNNILEQSKMYATGDTERFVKKHAVDTKKLDKPSEDDKLFKATNIKTVEREGENHGHSTGNDESVYEDVQQVAEDVEQIEEGADAGKRYHEYHAQAKGLLDSISKHLDTASKSRGDNIHWGHVGDVRGVHDQLRDIHDRLAETGEYAKADAAMQKKYASMREEVELTEEVDSADFLSVILEGFETDEEREEFLSLIETEEGCAEVLAMIDEAIAEAAAEE